MKFAFCLPVFNEQDGIVDYLEDLRLSFQDLDVKFFITEDASTDLTRSLLQEYVTRFSNFVLIKHELNQGHGKSLCDAVAAAIESKPLLLLTFDGDGQVSGRELRKFLDKFVSSSFSYGEAIRLNRRDPWFRRLISLVTRIMILLASGRRTLDGNTPVRIYTLESASKMWAPLIGSGLVIPNLYISSFVQLMKIPVFIGSVMWRDRLGQSVVGAGWGLQRFKVLPSKRLITFCFKAGIQWFSKTPRYFLKSTR
jgi:glycosyltransferase involved in cell wall biosynthesis